MWLKTSFSFPTQWISSTSGIMLLANKTWPQPVWGKWRQRLICLWTIFLVKWVRFFVFTETEFPKNYRQLPKTAEDFNRLPKIAEGFERFPKISQQLPKITEGVERFSTTSKQGHNDFQPISSIIKGFWRCSDDFLNVKKQLNFDLIGF